MQRPAQSTWMQKPGLSATKMFVERLLAAECETLDSTDKSTSLLCDGALICALQRRWCQNSPKGAAAYWSYYYYGSTVPSCGFGSGVGEEMIALLLHRAADPNVENVEHNLQWGFEGDHSAKLLPLPLPPLASGPM